MLIKSSVPAWHFKTTVIASRPFELAVASDPDGLLVEACERQDAGETDVVDPFWATTWRAAAGLDQFLDAVELTDVRVLELGCGTGHVGIAAALRGAVVTMTDGVEAPLALVAHSIRPLHPQPAIKRLRFGIDVLDDDPFPIILSSDVTYLRELWPQLQTCAVAHLASGGQWLLSDPYREISSEFRRFIEHHTDWQYEELQMPMIDDPAHPIRIMRLRIAT